MRLSLVQTLLGEARPTPAGRWRTGWHHASLWDPVSLALSWPSRVEGRESTLHTGLPLSGLCPHAAPLGALPLRAPSSPYQPPKGPSRLRLWPDLPALAPGPEPRPSYIPAKSTETPCVPACACACASCRQGAGRSLGGDGWEQALGVLWGRPPSQGEGGQETRPWDFFQACSPCPATTLVQTCLIGLLRSRGERHQRGTGTTGLATGRTLAAAATQARQEPHGPCLPTQARAEARVQP